MNDSYNNSLINEFSNKGRKLINQLQEMFIAEVDEKDENEEIGKDDIK